MKHSLHPRKAVNVHHCLQEECTLPWRHKGAQVCTVGLDEQSANYLLSHSLVALSSVFYFTFVFVGGFEFSLLFSHSVFAFIFVGGFMFSLLFHINIHWRLHVQSFHSHSYLLAASCSVFYFIFVGGFVFSLCIHICICWQLHVQSLHSHSYSLAASSSNAS